MTETIRPTRIGDDAERGHIIQISHKNLLTICNALNSEAKHFDQLQKTLADAPAQSKLVWKMAAEDRRALTRELLKDS